MIINGGVKGIYNIPSTASASGVWSRFDQNINKSLGRWPIAAGNTASPVIASTISVSPYVKVINFFPGSGFGTTFSNPGTLPSGPGNDIQFSPDNSSIVWVELSGGIVKVLSWGSTGFGSTLSNITVGSTYYAKSAQISPSGNFIAIRFVTNLSVGYVSIYNFNATTGIGSFRSSATVGTDNITSNGYDFVKWSPLEDSIITTTYNSPSSTLYGFTFNSITGVIGTAVELEFAANYDYYRGSIHPSGKALAIGGSFLSLHLFSYSSSTASAVSAGSVGTGGSAAVDASYSKDGTFLLASTPSNIYIHSTNSVNGAYISTITSSATGYTTGRSTISYSSSDILYDLSNTTSYGIRGYPVTRTGSVPTGIGTSYSASFTSGSSVTTYSIVTNNYNY